jgi:glycerol-3-phosphate cytidylyltransferase
MSDFKKHKQPRRVITYGTFDLFHFGHLQILKRAASLGDFLMVAVSTDEFNQVKGKECYYSFEHRAAIVESLSCVSQVIPEGNWNQKVDDILENDIDVLVMGDDWKGHFDDLKKYCEVIYLPRTEGISTNMIKQDLSTL